MAGRASAPVRGGILGDQTRWLEQKLAEAARLKAQAEAEARRAVQTATRYGQRAVAQGQAIANDVSRKVSSLAGPAPSSSRRPPVQRSPATRPATSQPKRPNVLRQAGDQSWAAARGAQDAFTFGLGDRVWAGGGALIDATHGKDLGEAYSQRMATERARDAYDEQNYKVARVAGQLLGTGAQIAATGGLGGLGARGAAVALRSAGVAPRLLRLAEGGSRIPQAARLVPQEVAAITGAGGGFGVASQAVSDIGHGRLSGVGDYAGAGVGGALGALSLGKLGPTTAGAIEGAATSLMQDLANRRDISLERVQRSALLGGALGGVGGLAGRGWSNALERETKEHLGEAVSLLRTRLRGDRTVTTAKTREHMSNGKYTYPDQRTAAGQLVESKFGRRARLSARQNEATDLLKNYRVDHTLPRDIGALAGLPLSTIGILNYQDLYDLDLK